MIRTTIFYHILLLSALCSAQDYWIPSQTSTQLDLRTLFFTDTLNGWAAGDSGIIIHSSDGGNSWISQSSLVNSLILDIFFVSPKTGWAISWNINFPTYNTAIIKTTDGGQNWAIQSYSANQVLFRTLFFHDSLNGWIAGEDGKIEKTNDGGDNWVPVVVDSGLFSQFPIIHLNYFKSKLGFACGGVFDVAGVVWRSTNSGEFWTSQVVGPEPIQMLWVFDSLNVVGVGGDFEYGTGLIQTTDGGDTWNYTSLTILGIARAISFRTPAEGWVPMGFANKFVFSMDSAKTWNEYFLPDNQGAYDVVFPDPMHGFAAGINGMIFTYNRFLATSPQLQSPPNGTSGVSTSPSLSWAALNGAETYDLQVSTQPDFSLLFIDESQISSTNFAVTGLSTNTQYYWRVRGNNVTGSSRWSNAWNFQTAPATAITPDGAHLPESFQLAQNYPNPFNSFTRIKYAVPVHSRLRMSLFDILGKELTILINTRVAPGNYSLDWEAGNDLPSGIYLLRMEARGNEIRCRDFQAIRKIILLK
jgi:photosystem II stability/assembly factor-like uncharacterized protein